MRQHQSHQYITKILERHLGIRKIQVMFLTILHVIGKNTAKVSSSMDFCEVEDFWFRGGAG